MEIEKRCMVTRAEARVTMVIIQFENFKLIPLFLEESSYPGVLNPLIEDKFGAGHTPVYTSVTKPADLSNTSEIPHQHLGFPRFLSWSRTDQSIVTHSGYFLFLQDELATPFDRFGQHIGLILIDNTILSPPIYPRPALCLTASGPAILKQSILDLTLILPGGLTLGQEGNTQDVRSTLLCFGNDTLDPTIPVSENERLLVISGNTIVEDKAAGVVWVPRTGLVVRLTGKDRETLNQNVVGREVIFKLKGLTGCSYAIQCGPLLVDNGEIVDLEQEFLDEQFLLENGVRLPPSRFPIDTDLTRAARFAIGINAEGHLVAVLVEGESSKDRIGVHSETGGMTLLELAELMVSLRMKTAMNFDGGGSVQGFLNGGGALVYTGDKHYSVQAHYDRPVPYGLVLE